ncbi:MAG: acylphosphatase [Candidatus Methanoperedens sp.]|nr:acylphosphatase [Candidatus Methanoperedens sp.]
MESAWRGSERTKSARKRGTVLEMISEMNQLNLIRNSYMKLLMDTQVKRYNIIVRGKVQDVGFRDYLIALANIAKLRGYIFNDIDGTVKMILEGAKDTVNTFLNEIKSRKYVTGVEIESLQQKELSINFDIPVRFVKLSTDEMYDIDRKLGIGNDFLADIKTNTINIKNGIDDLKTNTINIERGIDNLKINTIDIKNGIYSLNSKFDSLNSKFDLFFEEQKEFNKNIIEHNFRLEKILEKLIEK